MILTRHQHAYKSGVLTIGNFDGVHLGHQDLINRVKAKAKQLNAKTQIMLFEPQPKEFFMGDSAPKRLTNLREKYNILSDYGIDEIICEHFSFSFRSLSADEFIQKILIDKLEIKHLIIGEDFKFGCDRSGDYKLLQQASKKYNFGLEKAEDFLLNAKRVSSTWVRDSLQQRDFAMAKQLLGRNFYIAGKVVAGKKLGRDLGVPTANIKPNFTPPITGVFATRAILENGQVYKAATSLGYNPSVENLNTPILEAHLLDFNADLYGQRLKIEFIDFLRAEMKFSDLASLKHQLQKDIEQVKNMNF